MLDLFKLLDFIKPSKAISGDPTFGPLIVLAFSSIFSGIPSIKKTSLLGVEKDLLDLKSIFFFLTSHRTFA